jgi:flavin-dependent dehydrogenase
MVKTAVCIIGSGPSGASTSLMLSQLKINHYIVDKAIFPRDKTCGDGLMMHAYKSLKFLDLLHRFLSNPNFLHTKKINLHINDNLKINIEESEERDMVISYGKRIHFDAFLVDNLSKEYTTCEFGNGVKNLEETEDGILVTLKNGKEILAKVVVGADGINSIVSKKLGFNKPNKEKSSTFISAYFKNVEHLTANNEAEIRLHYKKMPLFFYLFPLTNNQANVTLGGNTAKILKKNINLIDEIQAILNSHTKIAHKFTNAAQMSKWRGWGIPYNFTNQKVCGNRFLLVGDAAGLANAFYKEGVGTGMMSGILCAYKIADCLKEDDFSESFISSYKNDLKNEFGKLLRFSEFVLKVSNSKNIFSFFTRIYKHRIEKRAQKIVLKRSY